DGMTVLRSIKQRWPQSQVIVVTGYPSLETAKEAIRYGAYDYLAKPVEPEQIVNAAHRAALLKRWALVREESHDDAARAAACTTH
ncbi:MAG TPA: response regulator, partial [Burkholderiaceae bacterium]|nr:response regulator [Burkholderiaceae bacterium]